MGQINHLLCCIRENSSYYAANRVKNAGIDNKINNNTIEIWDILRKLY